MSEVDKLDSQTNVLRYLRVSALAYSASCLEELHTSIPE